MEAHELDTLASRLAEAFKPHMRQMIREAIREEASPPVGKDMGGEDFFRRLNEEIMTSLSAIYREISSVQGEGPDAGRNPKNAAQAGELMAEASERLDQVIQATEKATFEIMELVERNISAPEDLLSFIQAGDCTVQTQEKAQAICQRLSADMVQIMTCLSFQDLTGQRIKRVIDMLNRVRDMVAELYVSTGILMKAKEKAPTERLEELKKDAKGKVSQAEVDDLLAQLGG